MNLYASLHARRAMLLSADKLAVYHWAEGGLAEGFLFDTDEAGQAHFRRYLQASARAPFYILLDVFEEDYRSETIPHVFGADRAAVIERKVARLFRSTPYYAHRLLGREETGRRHDQILLSAITNPDILKPWVAMLEEEKVPLAAICSLPLFTESILENIKDKPHKHKLIVSIQAISGLRQTYFHDDAFRISRLVRMPRYGTVAYAPYIKQEVEKIRRYLNSLRLMDAQEPEPLQIYFLLAGELLEELRDAYSSADYAHLAFCDLNSLLAAAGDKLPARITAPFSDRYFAQQLLARRPPDCYAQKTEKRYFFMRRLRYGMVAAGLVLLLGGFLWSAINLINGLGYRQDSLAARQRAETYDLLHELARQRLPKTPAPPAELKVAIQLAATLVAHKTSPLELMQVVSHALEGYPTIQLLSMRWSAGLDPDAGIDGDASAQAAGALGIDGQADAEIGFDQYQLASIDGRIAPFAGDYRQAIGLIERFAECLRQGDNVHAVRVLALPLDVRATASLQGSAQQQAGEADFSIAVVVGLQHDPEHDPEHNTGHSPQQGS